MAEQVDNGGRKNAVAAIERALRDAHTSGVSRGELDAIVERATVSDVDRVRLRRLVGELHGERAPVRREQPRQLAAAPAVQMVPPQNRDAEENVLGAMMISGRAIDVAAETVDAGDFYLESHTKIYRAAVALHRRGGPVDVITLTDELEARGDLDAVGGRTRLHELAALVPATGNVGHYARIVADLARIRGLIRAGGEIAQLGWERPGDAPDLLDRARTIAEEATRPSFDVQLRDRIIPGGTFILDAPETATAVWGTPGDVAWAAGEGLMICGPQGVGKTTLMQQLALARIGLRPDMLGFPVADDGRPILYIAADRPRQVQRSLARMVDEKVRATLDERFLVHRGPTNPLITTDQNALVRLAQQVGAGTVFIDSLKDVAAKLADDEYGGRINLAFQALIAAGVELVVAHHQRKASTDNKKPTKLDDVYGSTWITSGLGSVLLLWGEPGDVVVELNHLKKPAEELGPWNLEHDHAHGLTTRAKQVELIDIVYRASTEGVTATAAAEVVYVTESPTRNQVEKIRRRLERLADNGDVTKKAGSRGNDAPRYVHRVAAGANT